MKRASTVATGALGAALFWSSQASASGSPPFGVVEAAVGLPALLGSGYLALSAAQRERSSGLLIATGSVGSILAITSDVVVLQQHDGSVREAPWPWLSMLTNQVALGAFFQLGSERKDMLTAYGLSWGYGANLGLSLVAIGELADGGRVTDLQWGTGLVNFAAQWGVTLWRLRKPINSTSEALALTSCGWATLIAGLQTAGWLLGERSPTLLANLPLRVVPDFDPRQQRLGIMAIGHW